jgi:hypothetical protein
MPYVSYRAVGKLSVAPSAVERLEPMMEPTGWITHCSYIDLVRWELSLGT